MANEVLKLNEQGTVVFENIEQRLQFAETMLRSGMLPKSYNNKEQVAAALQLAAELGLKPGIKSLSRTANINGTPNLFGEAPLAVVQSSGLMQDWLGYYFDAELNRICFENKNIKNPVFGYYFKCLRVGKTNYHEETYTLDQAKKAGLGNVWNKHPEDMLRWRTIGKALKTEFADVLTGAQIAEYDNNTAVDYGAIKIDTGNNNVESDTNERFKETVSEAKTPEVIEKVTIATQGVSVSLDDESSVDSVLLNALAEKKKEEKAPKAFNPKSTDHNDLSKYVIPMGNYKGKTLKSVALSELMSMIPKLQGYIAKRPVDSEIAQDLLNSISLWVEQQEGF